MQKHQAKNIIFKISNMDKTELISYSQKVYLSKEDIDRKSFTFIERALDMQMARLCEFSNVSPIAVCSEIEED